jgi:threonine/homoserine/homoserine lactone efflux protein
MPLFFQDCLGARMTIKLLTIFAITEFFLSLTPGPAVLLVISQGMKNGFKSSIRGAIGILTGNAIYFGLSALGLGALLLASATLFQVIKWIGAAYLIFIGLKMLIASRSADQNDKEANARSGCFPKGWSLNCPTQKR